MNHRLVAYEKFNNKKLTWMHEGYKKNNQFDNFTVSIECACVCVFVCKMHNATEYNNNVFFWIGEQKR